MKRSRVDLSNLTAVCGQLGRLMTAMHLPVFAGDSIELQSRHIIYMSQLRRQIVVDGQLDLAVFYTKHRHTYPNWEDFILAGHNETETLASTTTAKKYDFLPDGHLIGARPNWACLPYFDIWNRYYRPANQGIPERTFAEPFTDSERNFGLACARLEAIWASGVENVAAAGESQVPSATVVDTIAIDQARARRDAAQAQEFFGQYYNDQLQRRFGGRATTDADPRPTLVWHETLNLGGSNIFGTDTSSLGVRAGVQQGVVYLDLPRFYAPEHGALWVMVLVRYPVMHEKEVHYLRKIADPSYKQFACDPFLLANEPPWTPQVSDFFNSSSTVGLNTQPYGNWFRMQPNMIHDQFSYLQGYPFSSSVPTNKEQAVLEWPDDLNEMFMSNAAGHWQMQSEFDIACDRVIPDAFDSIFTGGNR